MDHRGDSRPGSRFHLEWNRYDSYRPEDRARINVDRPRDSEASARPPVKDRPSLPSRRNSRATAGTDGPSSNTTPIESPRSPLTTIAFGDAEPANQASNDPRLRKAPSVQSIQSLDKAVMQPNDTTFESWILALNQTAINKNDLDKSRTVLVKIKEEEAIQRAKLPDHTPLAEILAKRSRDHEDEVKRLSELVRQSESKSRAILQSQPDYVQSLISGKAPQVQHVPPQLSATKDRAATEPSIAELLKRLEILAVKDKLRQAELEKFQKRYDSEQFSLKNTEARLSDKLQAEVEAIRTKQNELSDAFQKQQSVVNEQAEILRTYQMTLNSHKTALSELHEAQISHAESASAGDTGELTELQSVVKDQEQKLANLSTVFASSKDHDDTRIEVGKLEASLQGKPDAVQLDIVKNQLATLREKVDALTTSLNMKTVDVAARFESFQSNTSKMIEEAEERLKKEGIAFAGNAERSQAETDSTSYRKTVDNKLESTEKSLIDVRKQVEFLNRNTAPSIMVQSGLQNLEAKFKNHMNNTNTGFELCKHSLSSVHEKVDKLRPIVDRNDHSIKNLDTRYNNISTQTLYKSIVAAVHPTLEQLLASSNQFKDQIASLATESQRMNGEVSVLKTSAQANSPSDDVKLTEIQSRISDVEQKVDSNANTYVRPETIDDIRQCVSELKADRNKTTDDGVLVQTKQRVDHLVTSNDELGRKLEECRSDLGSLLDSCTKLQEHMDGISKKKEEQEKRCQALYDSQGKRLDTISSDLEKMKTEQSQLEGVRTAIDTLRDHNSRVEKVTADVRALGTKHEALKSDLHLCKGTVDSPDGPLHALSKRVNHLTDTAVDTKERLAGLVQYTFSNPDDRYIKIGNLASNIHEPYIRRELQGWNVHDVWFHGRKAAQGNTTTRHALVRIAESTDTDVDEIINKYRHGTIRWRGRRPEFWHADSKTIKNMLLDKTEDNPPSNGLLNTYVQSREQTDDATESTRSHATEELGTIVVNTETSEADPENYLAPWTRQSQIESSWRRKNKAAGGSLTGTPASPSTRFLKRNASQNSATRQDSSSKRLRTG